MRVVRRLNAQGKLATVDVLGEEIASAEEARAIARAYHEVLARDRARAASTRTSPSSSTGARARARRRRSAARNLEAVVRDAARARQLRPHRHGGLLDDRRDARALPRAARGRATRTSASSSRPACGGRSTTSRARRPAPERPPLQGHLRRAAERSRSRTPTRSARASSRCLERAARQRQLRRRSRRTTSG